MNRHPLSLEHETFHDQEPQTILRLAIEAGFDGVCLRIVRGRKDNFPIIGDTPMRREVRNLCKEHGVRIFGSESTFIGPRFDPESHRDMFETLAFLEVPYVSIIVIDTDTKRAGENIAAFSAIGREFGVRPYIEATRLSACKTAADAVDIIGTYCDGNTGIAFDALHLTRAGTTPEEMASIDPSLVCYFQICDGPAHLPEDQWMNEAWGGRLVPGEGEFTLRQFVDVLPDGVTIGIEAPNWAFNASGESLEKRARYMAEKTRALLGDRLLPPAR